MTAINDTSTLWSAALTRTDACSHLIEFGPDCCWFYPVCCWVRC